MQRYKFIDKIFIANVNIFELWVGGVWRISRLTHFLDVESELRDLYELIRFVKNIKGCRWKTSRFAWPCVQFTQFVSLSDVLYMPHRLHEKCFWSVRMAGTLVLSTERSREMVVWLNLDSNILFVSRQLWVSMRFLLQSNPSFSHIHKKLRVI